MVSAAYFSRFYLVFELVAAAIQAGMDSVVILLRIKASKAVSE